jgi:hypothetical protein
MTRYRTGLTLIGVGAFASFAVHASAFDPRAAGYVLIMAGVLALALPRRRAPGGARRSLLIRHYQRDADSLRPPSTERSSGRWR